MFLKIAYNELLLVGRAQNIDKIKNTRCKNIFGVFTFCIKLFKLVSEYPLFVHEILRIYYYAGTEFFDLIFPVNSGMVHMSV